MSTHFATIIDTMDAEVFSGDALLSKHNRGIFRSHLERWTRALEKHEQDAFNAAIDGKHWGCYRIELQGKKKWTPLRTKRSLYFGKGYSITQEQAHTYAGLELRDAKLRYPGRCLRIGLLEKSS